MLNCGLHLLLLDAIVLVVLGLAGQTLPGKLAFKEVQQDVADGLHIVSPGLLDANVSVDRGISGRARKRLVISVWNMLARLGILVALAQTKVDQVDRALFVADAHQEIVRLHIAMDEVVRVHELEAADHLLGQHAHGLQSELTTAVLEQIFERMSEQLHDHGFVVALDSIPHYIGDALYAYETRNQ